MTAACLVLLPCLGGFSMSVLDESKVIKCIMDGLPGFVGEQQVMYDNARWIPLLVTGEQWAEKSENRKMPKDDQLPWS